MNRKERIIEILKRNSNYPWGYQSLGEDDFDNVADEICAEPEECRHDLRTKNSENGIETYCIRGCGYSLVHVDNNITPLKP